MEALIEVNDTKAFLMETLEIGGAELVSIRQMYKKRDDMETWRASKKGIAVSVDVAKQIGEKLIQIAENPEHTKFRHVAVDPATQFSEKQS